MVCYWSNTQSRLVVAVLRPRGFARRGKRRRSPTLANGFECSSIWRIDLTHKSIHWK